MQKELLDKLKAITDEEQNIINSGNQISQKLYTYQEAAPSEFTIDSERLLEKGRLIEVRPHTRFASFPKHRHNYVELVYMAEGRTTHILNDTDRIDLQTGDLLFLNQNATHEILPAGENDIAINFIILPDFFSRPISMIEYENILRDFFLQALSGKTSLYSYLHFSAKDILPVQNLIENMVWTIFSSQKNTNTINQTTMGLLLMNLSLFAEKINRSMPEQYEQTIIFTVLKYIETHYKDGSLEDISKKIKQPTYQVSRFLKKNLNKNFKELLQERKLQQAAYLLSQSSLSIEQIMSAIGYNNSSYFYNLFKAKYKCSPARYRQEKYSH